MNDINFEHIKNTHHYPYDTGECWIYFRLFDFILEGISIDDILVECDDNSLEEIQSHIKQIINSREDKRKEIKLERDKVIEKEKQYFKDYGEECEIEDPDIDPEEYGFQYTTPLELFDRKHKEGYFFSSKDFFKHK